MIEQMKASIMKFVNVLYPSLTLYDEESNTNKIKSPSCYFNSPFASGSIFTKDEYANTFTMNILILHDTTNKAIELGNNIIDEIMANKSRVYLYNKDGTISDEYLQITELSCEESSEDSARLQLIWSVNKPFKEVN